MNSGQSCALAISRNGVVRPVPCRRRRARQRRRTGLPAGLDCAAPGVEAYVEPKTTVTDVTVVLVADDGEWTRRRVDLWLTTASCIESGTQGD